MSREGMCLIKFKIRKFFFKSCKSFNKSLKCSSIKPNLYDSQQTYKPIKIQMFHISSDVYDSVFAVYDRPTAGATKPKKSKHRRGNADDSFRHFWVGAESVESIGSDYNLPFISFQSKAFLLHIAGFKQIKLVTLQIDTRQILESIFCYLVYIFIIVIENSI